MECLSTGCAGACISILQLFSIQFPPTSTRLSSSASQAPGILITPHIGGAVRNMRARSYKNVLAQLDKYLAGEPLENVRLHGY